VVYSHINSKSRSFAKYVLVREHPESDFVFIDNATQIIKSWFQLLNNFMALRLFSFIIDFLRKIGCFIITFNPDVSYFSLDLRIMARYFLYFH